LHDLDKLGKPAGYQGGDLNSRSWGRRHGHREKTPIYVRNGHLGLALPIMVDRNAWLKQWGKRLRESLAASECGPIDGQMQRLLDELEKRETRAAPGAPMRMPPARRSGD